MNDEEGEMRWTVTRDYENQDALCPVERVDEAWAMKSARFAWENSAAPMGECPPLPDFLIPIAHREFTFEAPILNGKEPAGRCPECDQVDVGQTGEYPCKACGLPTTWDDVERMTVDQWVEGQRTAESV